MTRYLLSLVIWAPAIGAAAVAVIPRGREALQKVAAGIATLAPFGLGLYLLFEFEVGEAGLQFVEEAAWIPALGVKYLLGVDGISLFMVVLTVFLFPLALAATTDQITDRRKEYLIFMLLLETAILGAFLAIDLFLFFLFWEAMLVPMYFLIAGWGGERRNYAAIKFFLYTMLGSAFLLVGIFVLAYSASTSTGALTFDLRELLDVPLARNLQVWLFVAFGLSFAVKVPVFPLHTWLPDAHTEAPTAGSIILAGVLLKLGAYGFLRFSIPLFPQAAVELIWVLVVLALVGIVYGAVVCIAQSDIKRLVAYSSVSHLGFVVLGIFALTLQGVQGGILQMLNHGIATGALFLLVGMVYERRHTREIGQFGGIAKAMPVYAGIFLVTVFASIGLPGLGGFVGEFLVLLGSFVRNRVVAAVAALGVILAAVYLLWAYQRVFNGPLDKEENKRLVDLSPREIAVAVPLVLLMFFVGFYPKPFLERSEPAVRALITRVEKATSLRAPAVPAPKDGGDLHAREVGP